MSDTAVRDANPMPASAGAVDGVLADWRTRERLAASGTLRAARRADLGNPNRSERTGAGTGATQPVETNRHFRTLTRWRGRVTEVGEQTFRAIIEEMDRPIPEREVAIYVSEVSPADRPLLREGAIFYWSIGYVDTLGGQRTRQSAIKFQRRPGWTADDQHAAEQWAARMARLVRRV